MAQDNNSRMSSFLGSLGQGLARELPEATFFSFQNQFGGSPTQRRYYQGQFSNIFNQYLGTLGQQLSQGQSPPAFQDFMGGYNFGQQFAQLPPSIRGATTARFAPQTRFLRF